MKSLSCMTCLLIALSPVLLPPVSRGGEGISSIETLLQEAGEASAGGAFQEALKKVEEAQTLFENMDGDSEQGHPVWEGFLDVFIELKQDERSLLELQSL